MKRYILIPAILAFVLTSCEIQPTAGFFASDVEVETGDQVYFTNNSLNAVSYEWDFGDGTISNDPNPVHSYDVTGTFTVTLTAWSKTDASDQSFMDITVYYPTTLQVEVLEYYDEYAVENASVILYPTYDDWVNETNSLIEGFTNADGIVIFTKLDPVRYYLDVWEQNHNNYTLAGEDIGFIETPVLVPHEINYFTAWVDYVPSKGGERNRTLVIRKLKRKYSDKKK